MNSRIYSQFVLSVDSLGTPKFAASVLSEGSLVQCALHLWGLGYLKVASIQNYTCRIVPIILMTSLTNRMWQKCHHLNFRALQFTLALLEA